MGYKIKRNSQIIYNFLFMTWLLLGIWHGIVPHGFGLLACRVRHTRTTGFGTLSQTCILFLEVGFELECLQCRTLKLYYKQ